MPRICPCRSGVQWISPISPSRLSPPLLAFCGFVLTAFLQTIDQHVTIRRRFCASLVGMRMNAFAIGLAVGLAGPLLPAETLYLRVEPDREYFLAGSPDEVVVKIDLYASDHKKGPRRT